MKAIHITAIGLVGLAIGSILWLSGNNKPTHQREALAIVRLPATFSAKALQGRAQFSEKCAACHGTNGEGKNGFAPPLVHKIYEPGHHGDGAFYRAAKYGVRAHHWPFGNMPPIEGVTQNEIAQIISYIRELQRANGIS